MKHLIGFLASIVFAARYSASLVSTFSLTPTTLANAFYSISQDAGVLVMAHLSEVSIY